MSSETHAAMKREQGVALIVTVVTLVIATMIGLTALQHTQEESTAGGRARATARTLHGADAGIQFAMGRLAQDPPNLNAFSVTLANGVTVESRARADATPQDLVEVGGGEGAAAEGYAMNVGSGTGFAARVYRLNITAISGSSVAEVETLVSRPEPAGAGY